MSDKTNTAAVGAAGASFPTSTVLTILFVLMKVFGKIAWSWWWVFAPMWIPVVLVVVLLAVVLGIGIIAALAT